MSLSGLGRALQLNRLLLIGASYPPAMNALFTTTAILDGVREESDAQPAKPCQHASHLHQRQPDRLNQIHVTMPDPATPFLAKRRCKSDLTRTKSALAVRVRNIDSNSSALLCCLCI
jgi:hypothetical protein